MLTKRLTLLLACFALSIPARETIAGEEKSETPQVKQQQSGHQPARPKITISKETTYILGPVTKDGRVDYLAAVNQLTSKGVTPENNAVVPLIRALGPSVVFKAMRREFFERLGISPPAADGKYFVDLDEFGRELNDEDGFLNEYERATTNLWSAAEYPRLAEWLKRNERVLLLVREATRPACYYQPRVATDELPRMFQTELPITQGSRGLARALIARALLRAHAGDFDSALEDFQNTHRLARLIAQGSTLPESLVGMLIDTSASRGASAVATSGMMNGKQARRFLAELRKLPPLPPMMENISLAERLIVLDAMQSIAVGEADFLFDHSSSPTLWSDEIFTMLLQGYFSLGDWDEAFRSMNQTFDDVNIAARQTSFAERKQKVEQVVDNIHMSQIVTAITDSIPGETTRAILASMSSRKNLGQAYADLIAALFFPPMTATLQVEERAKMQRELTLLAFALAAHRADHESYPQRLEELTPAYVKSIPADRFSEKPLHYRRTKTGYLLYSVSINMTDDGGSDADLVVRAGKAE